MYVPIMWANPYDLDLIKENRQQERKDLNTVQIEKTEKEHYNHKPKAFEMLYRTLAFARLF